MPQMSRFLITGGSGFIGTHLVERLAEPDATILNLDLVPPKLETHTPWWQACDIKAGEALTTRVAAFAPTHVVHLAARTNLDGRTLEDYADNTLGTRNLLEALRACPTVERTVVASTQYVFRPGAAPESVRDYAPYSVYGESKVETERLTWALEPPGVWTIVRPTIVWGAWHPTMPQGIWRYIAKRWYLHPGREPIYRGYTFVGNVVAQIMAILQAPADDVHRQVLYLGEEPIDSFDWVNAFSVRLAGRPVRVVPRPVWRALAGVGDAAGRLGVGFPMTGARFRRMTTSDVSLVGETRARFGEPPHALEAAVDETVGWLRGERSSPADLS
jgi:nucleoside-diphosphate-sugar epimerase